MHTDFHNKIFNENCITGLQRLPDNSIDCCVTSPPYFGLRDYGTAQWEGGDENCDHFRSGKNDNPDALIQSRNKVDKGIADAIFKITCNKCGAVRIDSQIGLEETPDQYVDKLLQVFTEVRRVLKPQGTSWLNLGDTYAKYYGDKYGKAQSFSPTRDNIGNAPPSKKSFDFKTSGFKPKDLLGIPWMVAFALRSSGWWLRQDIIWSKPNPMPESVTDRCTKSHEYIFLLSKSEKYYYDQQSILQDVKQSTISDKRLYNPDYETSRPERGYPGQNSKGAGPLVRSGNKSRKDATERGCPETGVAGSVPWEGTKANKRSVWTVTTKPFSEAHFATFPEDLISDCIKAGCPPEGIVLDPFSGAGTTALVARKLGRNYVGFELNPDYIAISEKRLHKHLGLFQHTL